MSAVTAMSTLLLCVLFLAGYVNCQNKAPQFSTGGNLQRFRIQENTRVGDEVYTLKAVDPEGSTVMYGIQADFLQVNSVTGVVRVSRKIDYESAPTFNVLITASDGTSDTKLSVPIQVIDSNDEPPKFTRDIYKQAIDENTTVGTTIMRDIAVTDRDTINRLLQVRCAEEKIVGTDALDTCEKFGLITLQASNLNWTGVLVLRQPLDFESQTSYQVPLQSYDGNPDNNQTVSVEITINPIQDTPPRWVKAPSRSIKESVPIRFLVTEVLAEDGDGGNPRPIRYEIFNNPGNYFVIDDVSGEITTSKKVDRENGDFNQGFVILGLRARELIDGTSVPPVLGNDPQTTAVTTVRITIEDVNDNPPTFGQSTYVVEIPEDIPTGTALPGLFMTVTDSDSLYQFEAGNLTAYTFSLSNHTQEFEVFPGQGQGTTTVSMKVRDTNLIDYENGPREYVMKIIAREIGTKELFSSETTVLVKITDVNDNLPVFIPASYVADVREDAKENTYVIKVSAFDQDNTPGLGTPSIQYSLSGTDSNKFSIDKLSGEVTVNYCRTPGTRPCIDFEQLPFYELVVTASDQNGIGQIVPARLRINVLDVNDNSPRFLISNYGSTIMEKTKLPDPPVYVQASDRDGDSRMTYTVVSQDGTPGLFQIDTTSGFVSAVRNVRFNDTKPNTDQIKITVQASDGVFNTTALVTITVIDVNDGPPKFLDDLYESSIPETTRGVVSVTSVAAIDPDSTGSVTYEIVSGDQDKFDIDPLTGDIKTIATATFNFDMQPQYNMLVIARDDGSPQMTGTATVRVNILDKNNRDPYFQPANLRASVFENVEIGHVVRTISGLDPDNTADLHYSFGSPKRAYSPTGGEVNVADYDFTNLFSIGEKTGIIRTSAKLSRDETSLITYTLIVVDRNATGQTGTGSLIIDILDVNDKAPIFKPPWTTANPVYYQDLEEEKEVGTFVRVMVATDPDGSIDRYELVWNPGQFFKIDQETGQVTVSRQMDFDFDKGDPKPKVYNFTVRAHDNGLSPLFTDATVVVNLININDNTPRFNPLTYSATVYENGTAGGSQIGDFITTVTATDLDAGLFGDVFYNLSGTENRFAVDSNTGRITLLTDNIDREVTSELTFPVFAYDSDPSDQRSASVQVYIRVEDINDNPPIFTKPVYEKTIPEIFGSTQAILQLSATDRDINDINNLIYEHANRTDNVLFYIDPKSGFVQPTRPLQGRAGVYEMLVMVKDHGGVSPYNSDTSILRITVQSVTNHPPRWVIPPRDNMTIFVLEEQYLGLIVYDVEAEDQDSGNNGIVDYSFETATSDNITKTPEFRINSITGVIRAERVYDREETDKYTLVLVARDRGGLKNTVFLRIVIKDVNDHLPRFSPQEYSITVPESTPISSTIQTVTATDADDLLIAKTIYYKIIAGNEGGVFRIGEDNGVITLNKSLNAEDKQSYTLEVMGYNNVSDYSVISKRSLPQNIATVFILVTDTNDNPPRFTQRSFFSCVSTGTALGHNVLHLTAEDADSSSVLVYKFISANANDAKFFSLDPSTGIISNTMLMGNVAGKTYNFRVEVSDGVSKDNATVILFVTRPENEAMIVLAQPPNEVRSIQADLEKQLSALLTQRAEMTVDTRVCISRIENHIGTDASVNTAWSDVYFTGMYRGDVSPTIYVAISAANLVTRVEPLVTDVSYREELSIFYVRQVMEKPSTAQAIFLSTPALVVMILVIILFILAILLFICCCCCYNPRRHRRDKEKIISGAAGYAIEDQRSAEFVGAGVAPVVYDTGFNRAQAYENKGYVVEQSVQQNVVNDPVYATVQKKSHAERMETMERTDEAMEAHEHIEAVLREQTEPSERFETHTETRIVSDMPPESGPELQIITEPIPDDELEASGTRREANLVRQDALETQGIEVDFHDSPHGSPVLEHRITAQPGQRVEYVEETTKTVVM